MLTCIIYKLQIELYGINENNHPVTKTYFALWGYKNVSIIYIIDDFSNLFIEALT